MLRGKEGGGEGIIRVTRIMRRYSGYFNNVKQREIINKDVYVALVCCRLVFPDRV